ncbi:UNVERIFIED_CONTAM: protein unc-13 [Sesamum latifolium]|uniref:Protein unc-13 n=1 Tax=Sesamum latifolium TaxID=2727402 RepID=A0AAW2SN17_9LAMI
MAREKIGKYVEKSLDAACKRIAEISRSIILDWVVAQHDRILEWTGRAFDLEVLNNICGLIDDTIRDLVVSNIWKASLEGFMWVLLDGGPSRAFSDTDITMIEEDFNMLKDLFVADGEGLPRSLVEEQAKFYHQILNLFSLKTESLIRMLMASSERISVGVTSHKYGQRYLGDAHTLIRVLCHKKDREASTFLKTHYRLPSSSEYDDETAVEDSSFSSPLVSDIWKRSTSFRWSEKGHSSFRSIKKKLQEATWK